MISLQFLTAAPGVGQNAPSALLEAARTIQCPPTATTCLDFDAIVFVHGIYGGKATFRNSTTGFDWPSQWPLSVLGRPVDVYRLEYQSSLLSWAKGSNPAFDVIARDVLDAMRPLRKKQYRSIGFVAHSLGGNIVPTYIHMVKSKLGHPQRSQHAFLITLATPVLGSQMADIGGKLKSILGMKDPLLQSLASDNLYLTMLREFRTEEDIKANAYGCRPLQLFAAIEKKHLGPVLIVTSNSAAEPISDMVSSGIIAFPLDHFAMAKPPGPTAPVYTWTLSRVEREYSRLATWSAAHPQSEGQLLCERMALQPEQ